jgi:hypothetical protein
MPLNCADMFTQLVRQLFGEDRAPVPSDFFQHFLFPNSVSSTVIETGGSGLLQALRAEVAGDREGRPSIKKFVPSEYMTGAVDENVLDHPLQLAHIARPQTAPNPSHRSRIYCCDCPLSFSVALRDEVNGQEERVFSSSGKRWDFNANLRKAIVKVSSKVTFLDTLLETTICGSNNPCV